MKISIVTVYSSINSGSFLQAYALGETIKNLGYEVSYYKRKVKGGLSPFLDTVKTSISYLLHGKIRGMILAHKTYFSFLKDRKYFIIDSEKKVNKTADAVVIGSDTLWNISDNYFFAKQDVYFGKIFSNKKVVFYAVSVGETSAKQFSAKNLYAYSLDDSYALSVRDEKTKNIISAYVKKNIYNVIDPTFLIQTEKYNKFIKPIDVGKYILIYHYNKLKESTANAIQVYAKANNLNIIQLGKTDSWGDKCVTNSPENFITYFSRAELIVTNTFHGCVFSIIYNKPFVSCADNKDKVDDLLNIFDLNVRSLKGCVSFESIMSHEIDYETVNKKIKALRKFSLDYLANAIKGD